MSNPTEKLDIIVGDFPTDAALYNIKGVRTLFMSSAQTFSNAVENVRNVIPGITLEAAERMIREQCPEFKDLDDLLGRNIPTVPSVEHPAPEPADAAKEQLPSKRRRKAVLVAALLPALAASWALGRYTNVADTTPTDNGKTAAAPDKAPDDPGEAPFREPRFTHFAGASSIDCDPISPLEAECTDADGKVMSTKAATGPDSTVFTFSYGSERIGLRIFYEADYADTWARQDGTKDLYPNLEMHGRYALWGTDPSRVKDYGDLLSAPSGGDVQAMGGATPLPPRLAALTLGTLGLDQGEVHQLLAQSPTPVPTDTPAIMAARLVLGLDHVPPTPVLASVAGGEDIVAIAAGIEPVPSTGGTTAPPSDSGSTGAAGDTGGVDAGTSPPSTRPATQPTTGTDTSTGSEKPTQPSTPPAETEPPAEPPTEPSTPPAETKPPETTKPPATTAPATPPPDGTAPPEPTDPAPPEPVEPEAPAEPTEPPAEDIPAPPAEQTPPPTAETPTPPAGQAPDPGEETPPVEPPAGDPPAPPGRALGERGDLLILDSAWTVAAA
ncbi:hypothetical protein ACFVFT_38710 [Streptomyces tendae]|uniref:hypothetical protein n=1 Tax=Streptomyces tendae TaxID=1932 RepID=UPI0036B917A8